MNQRNHKYYILLITLLGIVNLPFSANSQCLIDGINGSPFEILDNTTFEIKIEVTDDNHDSLNGPQGICGVRLNFEHTLISDLRIDIFSPNDTFVNLIGPALRNITTPTLFPINHNITFLPSSDTPMPDGFTPQRWTNANANWATLAEYTGSYYPASGDLDTVFSSGPVDGVWRIRVSDTELNDQGLLHSVELIFCDPSGINCLICEADGGTYAMPIEHCEGDVLLLPQYQITSDAPTDEYGFLYFFESDSGVEIIDETYSFENLSDGTYFISALNVANQDSLSILNDLLNGIAIDDLSNDYCFNKSDSPLELTVLSSDTLMTIFPFCNDVPTILDGNLVQNIDTVIFRPVAGCATVEKITFNSSSISAEIVGDTVVIPCNSAPVTIDGSSSDLGTDGVVNWTLNGVALNGLNSTVIDIDFPGSYVMTIDDNGCTSRDTIRAIFEFQIKEYDFEVSGPLNCSDSVVTVGFVDHNSIFSANWTGPGILGDSTFVGSITVNQPGKYKVMGIDSSSCQYTRMVEVESAMGIEPISITSDTFSCDVDSIAWNLMSLNDKFNFNWTQGAMTGSGSLVAGQVYNFSTMSSDTIYYNVISSTGCTLDTFYIVPVDANFVSVQGRNDTLNCVNNSVTLNANSNNSNAIYKWTLDDNFFSDAEEITTMEPGSYQLIASLDNGCSDTADFDVIIDTLSPLISFTQDGNITCTKDNVTLSVDITEGSIVQWNIPNAATPNALTQIVSDPGMYTAMISNAENGCVDAINFEVVSNIQLPIFNIDIQNISCNNPIGRFEIFSSESITVDLSINGGDLIRTNSFEVSDESKIDYIITGANGCTLVGSYTITSFVVYPFLNVPAVLSLDCNDNTALLQPEVNNSELKDLFYFLSNGDTLRSEFLVLDAPSSIEVVAVGINGCISSELVTVSKSILDGGVDLGIEEGMFCDVSQLEVDLSAVTNNPQLDFNWVLVGPSASIFELENSVFLSGSGTFVFELIDTINMCSISDTFDLSFVDEPLQPFNFVVQDESCLGFNDGFMDLMPTEGGEGDLQYFLDGIEITTLFVDSLSSGMFDLRVEDKLGCSRDTTFTILSGGNLQFDLGEDRVVFPREELSLNPNIQSDADIVTSFWVFNGDTIQQGTSFSFLPTEDGKLELNIINEDGCYLSDFINVTRAQALEDLVYIPNAIALNSSSGNNVLLGSFSEKIGLISSFNIYDRWGSVVHSLQNFLPGENLILWDAKVNAEAVASGVYVWYLEVVLENGVSEVTGGDITVLR